MFRLLEINFNNYEQLYPIHEWNFLNRNILYFYKIQIYYKLSNEFKIILYGFDKKEKWKSTDITSLNNIFTLIDTMPMKNIINEGKPNILYMCGFNEYIPSHCFKDLTHQTCCLLGYKAREYADKSGNPIGKASVDAFIKNYGFIPDKNILTPWCTCIGSQVCSFYSEKFGNIDGTHIKFIHDIKNNKITFDKNEIKYLVYKHSTPGILN